MKKPLIIATRESPLALYQANYVASLIVRQFPGLKIELLPMKTSGDKFYKDRLSTVGGKGLFVKELEEALLDKRADIAVHSMKDVPTELPAQLEIKAICQRESPLDVLISKNNKTFDNLPPEAMIGTSSLRRQSQLLALRPDLKIKTLRGNIQTRLAKFDANEYDAIILAQAGLERMQLQEKITEILSTDIMLPACGQGALGIECRKDDTDIQNYITPLNDDLSQLCVLSERHVNAKLGGNCHVPLAVYCMPLNQNELLLRAKVATIDGKVVIANTQRGSIHESITLAEKCANTLLENGAAALLTES